jgi:hypothetical protein
MSDSSGWLFHTELSVSNLERLVIIETHVFGAGGEIRIE